MSTKFTAVLTTFSIIFLAFGAKGMFVLSVICINSTETIGGRSIGFFDRKGKLIAVIIINSSTRLWIRTHFRFILPFLTMSSFFICCYFIARIIVKGEEQNPQVDKFSGIYFMISVAILLSISNV